jgi:RNA polymerase sigma-70 factor (ECF subfamily)
VRRTAINLALSDRRRRGAERRALERVGPPAESSDDGAGAVASADRFWRAVRELPRRQAAVVALHYVEDRSVAEIATVLEIAEGTVKAHLHQARAALSTSFAPEEER